MKIPPYLNPGDTIGLTCTARSITMEELQPAIAVIEGWGFKVKIGSAIGLVHDQFGGNDQQRAESFQHLLDDDTIKAILLCRGGYGTVRMLDLVDFQRLQSQPKWIIGFSDVTILHAHLNENFKTATLHASMPSVFNTNTSESLDSIRQALLGEPLSYPFAPHPLNKTGTAQAEIIGGNLSLLYSLIGTKHDVDTKGKILFMEDLDEYLYHIDRMMISLKNAGKLDHLAALVVGGMTDMNDNTIPFGKTVEEIIFEHTKDYDYPIAFNFPAGHIANNKAIVLGKEVKITIGSDSVQWEQ